jgi:hypothetical protein
MTIQYTYYCMKHGVAIIALSGCKYYSHITSSVTVT